MHCVLVSSQYLHSIPHRALEDIIPYLPRTPFCPTQLDALPCFSDAAAICVCAAANANNEVNVACSKVGSWPTTNPFPVKLKATQGVSPCNDVKEATTYITVVNPPTVDINGPRSSSVCDEQQKTFTFQFSPSTATVTASANNSVSCNPGKTWCRVRRLT